MEYDDDDIKLPLELQMWLLEQSRHFLKAKFDDNKYEASCVLFERLLCGYVKRELKGKLQVAYVDLIKQLKSVENWDFVKAACPYVIQCVAQVLSNRRNLGMNDRLSVAVTKLLSTLHWCFIDAPADCGLDPCAVLFPVKSIELFIQLLVPCAHELREQDLAFSLKSGTVIWQPLWRNLCPDIPSFKRPVLLEKCKHKSKSPDLPSSPIRNRGTVKYFDLVVLRSLSSNYLSEDSLAWSLSYILQILQSELFLFCDISESWPSHRHQRNATKRPVGLQHSLPLLNIGNRSLGSSATSIVSDPGSQKAATRAASPKSYSLQPVYVSDAYEQWLEENGTINHGAVLNLVYRVTQKATLHLCETLLYMLHILVEIGVVNISDNNKDIDSNLETVVHCLLDLTTLIGCFNGDSGLRGSKGQNLRLLSHDMFAKLLSTHREQMSVLTIVYIKNKPISYLLEFMHSFTGVCFAKISLTPPSSPKRRSLGSPEITHCSFQNEDSNVSPSSDVMNKNEETLLNWLCILILEKLMDEEKSCKGIHREKVSKIFVYILTHHPRELRRMVMNGILRSFSKSTKVPAEERPADTSSNVVLKAEVAMPNMKDLKSKTKRKLRTKGNATGYRPSVLKRLPFVRSRGITFDYSTDQPDVASPEPQPSVHQAVSRPIKSSKEPSKHMLHSSKFKIFKGGKRTRYGTLVYDAVDEEDASQVFTERTQKPAKLNLTELLKGMKAFRFMNSFVAPGHLPEKALIAALMDLKAPVLSRAALLIECCHFVKLCNKGDWDPMSRPEFTSKKDMAMMFYKWGITVGNKLAAIIAKESVSDMKRPEDTRRYEPVERDVLHEGDLSVVSSDCPYTIKLLACQLLLEITSFLRDNYLVYLSERDTSSACLPRSSSESPRRISTVSSTRGRKSLHLTVPVAPVFSVQKEAGVPTQASRKSVAYTRFGVSTSPKYQRKISRKTTRCQHYQQGERRISRTYKDNQHITSSFDEDDEIPLEASDFPWMPSVISLIKAIDKKITIGRYDSVLAKLERSWKTLLEGLEALYNPKKDSSNVVERRRALIGDLMNTQIKIEDSSTDPILDYIRSEVAGLQHAPLSVMCKAALVTDRMQIMEVMPCAWRLLTHADQHLAATAAAMVLIAGTKLDGFVTSFIKKEMSNEDPIDRAKAVLRFGVLWKYRHNAFSKMEINAVTEIKILPPKIEYTLPSPLIGRDPPSTTDAPWFAGSPFPEETGELEIIQTEWYYDEEKRLALKEEQRAEKLKELRRGFRLLTVPLSQEAGKEAKRNVEDSEAEEDWIPTPMQDSVGARELFPPAICAVALDVIRLLDDSSMDTNRVSVSSLAYQVVWQCLVEEPELFFRSVYEKITKTDKQDEILLVLRKLLQQIPELPPVAGTLLFNNLAGLIMYYNRTNKPGCQERISSVLDVLWKVAPSVSGLVLKEMKQTLRKDNCEHVFMITANVPGVKEIRVLFNKNLEKFDVNENMTFASLIEESERMFDCHDRSFVLVDKHSGALMEGTQLVRDAYAFKRGFPAPVVKLVTMGRAECYEQRQRQAFFVKLSEISRLNLSKSIFCGNPSQKHINFLFLEFLKQNAFPRKAIEFEFHLCHSRGMVKELMGLDVSLKDSWVKFVGLLLGNLCEPTTAGYEIELFLNVINGAFLLLCENIIILRSCLAGFLNISRHFGHIFAVSGYRYILPTLLKAYSQHQDNSLVVDAIEFIVGQFFILHQSPFLLQLFASAAPMVLSEVTQNLLDCPKVDHIPAVVLCKLLLSLDRKIPDSLDILSLVCGEKPVQAYDAACKIELVEFSVTDVAIRLAVTVIACEPRSQRGTEMLIVIAAIAPHYLIYLKQQTVLCGRSDDEIEGREVLTRELKQLRVFYNYVKVIIDNSNHLGISFTAEFTQTPDPDVSFFDDDDALAAKPAILSLSWWGRTLGSVKSWFGWDSDQSTVPDDLDRISVIDELPVSTEEKIALRKFCLPRVSLLFLATELLTNVASRVKEIRTMVPRKTSFPEIVMEARQVSTLTSIVSSVIALAPKNQEVLANVGLQRFILSAVPSIYWSCDNQTYFAHMVGKVNRVMQKLLRHPEHHEFISCNILEIMLRGICLTIWKHPQLSEIPEIKEMTDWCLQVIISDHFDEMNFSFSNMAAKVAARLIQVNPDTFSLLVACGDGHLASNLDRLERFLVNWLVPLCFRLGTGRYDYPRLSDNDVTFALSIILTRLSPFSPDLDLGSNSNLGSSNSLDQCNFTVIRTRSNSQSIVLTSKTYRILFLALKILVVAFEDGFKHHWKQVAEVMERLADGNENEPSLWDFFHFIVDNRSPLLIYLLPIIAEKVSAEENLSNEIRSLKTRIERDLWSPSTYHCRGDVLRRLLDDWMDLKRGDSGEVLQLLSPPPKGRVRSKSTHNDRSVMLTKFDKDWENYDDVSASVDDTSDDAMDGGTTVRKLSKRKPSSKRVKIFEEPTVIGDDEEKKDESNTEQMTSRTSKKNILKNRPLLKRQSAEEDEDSLRKEGNDQDSLDDDKQTRTESHSAFEWQRFSHVRKRETSKVSKSLKRGRWRRDNSYRYRKKMQHQISFNEDEEEVEDEQVEEVTGVKNDEGGEVMEENTEGPLWMTYKDLGPGKGERDFDRIIAKPWGDVIETNAVTKEQIQSSYLFENTVQGMSRLKSKEYFQVLGQPAKQGAVSDDENDNVRGSNEERLNKVKLMSARNDGSLLKEVTLQENERSQFEVHLDVHRQIVLKPNQLQSTLYNGKTLVSPSASSDAPLIDESDYAIEDTSIMDNLVIAPADSEADARKIQIGNGVPQNEHECIEVSMILGSESFENSSILGSESFENSSIL